MEKKKTLIPFLAVLAVLAFATVSANGMTSELSVSFNDVLLDDDTTISGITGEMVPVRVAFTAEEDDKDVRVRVRMEGFRDDVSASTERFNIIEGSAYSKLLSLRLPSDIDDLTKEFTLYVEVSSATGRTEEEYTVRMQRESYTFEVLSVDYNREANAGDSIPVSVVVKNTGMEMLEDGYVTVSIPDLDVSTKGFFGVTESVIDCDDYCDIPNSLQKTVHLRIPESADSGDYDMEIIAHNRETTTSVKRTVRVSEKKTLEALAPISSQVVKSGDSETYDLVLVNSEDNVKVFDINVVSGNELDVSAPSAVTVGPRSSSTVPITVYATREAEAGTYTFSAEIDGEEVVFEAQVSDEAVSGSMIALTVVLVIVFVVLLAVLIVLLTRRDNSKPEEVETSYY